MALFTKEPPQEIQQIKEAFASWAASNLRVRKPLPEEQWDDDTNYIKNGNDAYRANVPLLKDTAPEALEIVINHFNQMTDLHWRYQQSMLGFDLAKKQSGIMQSLHDALTRHQEDHALSPPLHVVNLWKTTYVQAVDRYYDKMQKQVICRESNITVNPKPKGVVR